MDQKRLTDQQISALCRGLALMLHAGLPLSDGAFLLAEEEDGDLRAVLTRLGKGLDQGELLSACLEESGAFPGYVPGMVRIGENTGRMEETLNALASWYEERRRVAVRLRSAVAYPGLIFVLMICVVGVLLVQVLPVFQEVYASLGTRLTGAAAGLLKLGQLLKLSLPVLAGILAVAAIPVCVPSLRRRCAAALRRRLGDRGISRKFNNARFARALAMGLGSGLPLEEAVELARQLMADVPGAAKRCGLCAQALKEGTSLAEAMEKARLLPAAACRMLTVGLRGGNADQVIGEIAARLEEDAGDALDAAISRVEPAMVLAASMLVGLILLSVMLPLMNIMSSMG